MRKTSTCLLFLLCLSLSVYGQNHAALLERADDLILAGQYQEAITLLEETSGEKPSPLLENKKAEALTRAGYLDRAEAVLRAVQTRIALQPDNSAEAITLANTGYLQLNQGRSDLAEQSLQKALLLLESTHREASPEGAHTLSYLGLVYMSQGKYSQAQEQLHRALSLRQKESRNDHTLIAATYNDLGLSYSQTDKAVALSYYEQALKMYLHLYGKDDTRIAIANINIGIIYRDLELLGDAVNNFETALTIWNSKYPQPHAAKAIALYNLGQTYLKLNDQEAAMAYYERALKMYSDCFGPKHPEVASVLNAIGNLQVAEGAFDAALETYQEAIKANVQDFDEADSRVNPSRKNYYNGTRLLHSLLFKAQALEARYTRKSLKFSDLKEAINTLAVCDTLIDQLRHHSTNESDKIQLGVIANEVYADGVRMTYVAGLNAVNRDTYLERAFYFAEKSKGAVLLETISDTDARSFAGIPSELLENERELKSALSLNARKLAEKPSPDEERSLREISFTLKRKYDSFIQRLEQSYPEYFNLKFNSEPPSISQLQSQLDDKTGLISYFIDERHQQLYVFLIRKQHYRIWKRPLGGEIDKFITGVRNGIYFQEINTFRESAYTLGRTLLPPLPASLANLVIIPAGRLGVVPFETLLTEHPDDHTPYSAMPFLLNRYTIRYEFSAGLLLQKTRKPSIPAARSIFLCAPVNFPDKQFLGELPGTESEVQEISQLFSEKQLASVALTHHEAGERRIKQGALKDFDMLHFATHGVVDEMNPELSRIFLQSDKQEDGNLYAGEIYSLDLRANLVTLSACQTGMGKIVKGEGVIGLSRALVYAGARNIIVSFWNVADKSTAKLMKEFYSNLLHEPAPNYAHALREAKLGLMKDEQYSAPFYWAPFVLIGF